jgi:succinyl-diaminopimelate desuccinylase
MTVARSIPIQALLADLVRIPSPTPPGDCRAIAAFVANILNETGATVRVLAPPEKPEAQSVVATLGDGSRPVIFLHAHLDTVPVAEDERQHWTEDPYEPVIKDGKLYGKGSVDDKAPLAAMLQAFCYVASLPDRLGTLVLVAASEEEVGGRLGTKWLVDEGHLLAADFIVVGEQTHNRIALAHKGVMRASITTRGLSVHATSPDRGVNAITAMAKIMIALEQYHQRLRTRRHPLVGHPSCNVGVIAGGSTANTVPDFCTIHLDRRMIPKEDPETVKQELREVVASVDIGEASAEVHSFLYSSWFESELTTPYARAFQDRLHESFGSPQEVVGYLPGSDAKHLMALKRGDMIVFGPGSYEVAHAYDEYVELAELEQCEAILSNFLLKVFRQG